MANQFVYAACELIQSTVNTEQSLRTKVQCAASARFVELQSRTQPSSQVNPLLGRQVDRKVQFTLTRQPARFAGHKLGQSWAKACQQQKRQRQEKVRKSAEKLLSLNEEIRSDGNMRQLCQHYPQHRISASCPPLWVHWEKSTQLKQSVLLCEEKYN